MLSLREDLRNLSLKKQILNQPTILHYRSVGKGEHWGHFALPVS
jgi:hypothetical protein